jgi:hypothetical protein
METLEGQKTRQGQITLQEAVRHLHRANNPIAVGNLFPRNQLGIKRPHNKKIMGPSQRLSKMLQLPFKKTSTATLSSLTVSKGTWDSEFSKSEYTYHIAVSSSTEEVIINPTATYSSASALIEGGTDKTVKLTDRKTIINVQVTKGEDKKTYVLVFDKPAQTTTTATITTTDTTAVAANSDTGNAKTQAAAVNTVTQPKTNWQTHTQTNTSFWGKIVSFFKNIFS